MVSVRHDFHTRDFRKGQAYLDTQNLMQGGKAAEYSGFYTHSSSSGSDVIWLVSQLIYHILSLDLIFYLWPRWSILVTPLYTSKLLKKALIIKELSCLYPVNGSFFYTNIYLTFSFLFYLEAPSLLPFAPAQQKVLSLSLVLPL